MSHEEQAINPDLKQFWQPESTLKQFRSQHAMCLIFHPREVVNPIVEAASSAVK
ncbi:hypothetical protein [Trichocoleus sp. FACHB-591]|uniref:hypothetical protein n=1 Tax=Trichocoleus sp. FACHB-591 TaxID=2692872 RepID=UPI0016845985|nr:hypothetical protein [Trichocoleus sp. FACHB-591]